MVSHYYYYYYYYYYCYYYYYYYYIIIIIIIIIIIKLIIDLWDCKMDFFKHRTYIRAMSFLLSSTFRSMKLCAITIHDRCTEQDA